MTVAQRIRAAAMIGDKGQVVTIAGNTAGAYNPATGTGTLTPTSVTTTGTLLPLSHSRKIDGTTIVAGDETLLLSALNSAGAAYTEPKVGSVVTLSDSTKRVITAIDALAPAGLVIMFDAVVRKTP